MFKFINGNEREIEDMINEAVAKLPNTKIVQGVTPYCTTRGNMFCCLIKYGDIILPEEKAEREETDPPDESGKGETGANDNDKTGSDEKADEKS